MKKSFEVINSSHLINQKNVIKFDIQVNGHQNNLCM